MVVQNIVYSTPYMPSHESDNHPFERIAAEPTPAQNEQLRKGMLERAMVFLETAKRHDFSMAGNELLGGRYTQFGVLLPHRDPDGRQQKLVCDQLVLAPNTGRLLCGVRRVTVLYPRATLFTQCDPSGAEHATHIILRVDFRGGAADYIIVSQPAMYGFEEGGVIPMTGLEDDLLDLTAQPFNEDLALIFASYRLQAQDFDSDSEN